MAKTKEKRVRNKPALVPALPGPESKIDLAAALRLRIQDGLTYAQIGERFGVGESAVRGRLARFLYLCDDPSNLEAYRKQKADVFETLEHAIITQLWATVQTGRASVGDLARALDTVSKHVRLLAGQSTSNVSLLVQTLTDVHKDVDGALTPRPKIVDAETETDAELTHQ
jgi:hypothetical protein